MIYSGIDHKSLVSIPNIPGLNLKSLRGAYDVKEGREEGNH